MKKTELYLKGNKISGGRRRFLQIYRIDGKDSKAD